MLRVEKEKTVKELTEKLSEIKSLFLTDFRGLNVEEMSKLRRELRKGGAEYKITKNTMIRMAAQQTGLEAIVDYLKGPTGMVLSYQDPVAPAKVLYEINQKTEKPKIKIIWMEGRIIDGKHLKKLATLPPREVILTQMIFSLNAPLSNFVGTLQGILRNCVGVIEAIKDAKSEAA
jgi:large subunit ribosomal protein L10